MSYEDYDDGWYEAGWWVKRLTATNRTRYVVKTIGGDIVVFDRATGLMWAGDGLAAGCNNGEGIDWSIALTYAHELTFAGFTDWRVPNAIELFSIINQDMSPPRISEPPFSHTTSASYWSSTTYRGGTTYGYIVRFHDSNIRSELKTAECKLRLVRLGV